MIRHRRSYSDYREDYDRPHMIYDKSSLKSLGIDDFKGLVHFKLKNGE